MNPEKESILAHWLGWGQVLVAGGLLGWLLGFCLYRLEQMPRQSREELETSCSSGRCCGKHKKPPVTQGNEEELKTYHAEKEFQRQVDKHHETVQRGFEAVECCDRMIKEAKEEIAKEENPQVLTCAFCGEEYPPGTPTSQHELLTEHILRCSKHPARADIIKLIDELCKVPSEHLHSDLLILSSELSMRYNFRNPFNPWITEG
jgi:hypothetical protein